MFRDKLITIRITLLFFAAQFLIAGAVFAQFVSRPEWNQYAEQPDEWYQSPDGLKIIEIVLSWESAAGGWPKNQNTAAKPFTGDRKEIRESFDNGATTSEMRFLARAYLATKDPRCKEAVGRALDMILKAQYPTGGWPQSYPPGEQYHRHITFNDSAMTRIMQLLKDALSSKDFEWLDKDRRAAVEKSFNRGIYCILICQIIVGGKPTVWCAQHDEIDYSPRRGRSYELVSLSGSESAGILKFLMSLDNPSPEVIRAVKGGAEWFNRSKITGIKQIWVDGDKRIIEDKDAPPLWARFYEIETNRPFFCGRDGIKKYDMADIEPERRNHYGWYGDWGAAVAKQYAKWKDKWLKPGDCPDFRVNENGTVPFGHGTEVKKTIERADVVVAADGSGKFKTVQEAVDAAPHGNTKPYVIFIKPGVYRDLVAVPRGKSFIYFVGEDPETTVLTYYLDANHLDQDGKPIGTFKTPSTTIEGDDFQAENLTFENCWGIGSQALAIKVTGDRYVFRNCRFLGWQDTILIDAGRQYFKECYIAGHVDFIFGAATAYFERCRIHCRDKGYITAASTTEDQPFGFVFSNCTISGELGTRKSYLGRPWRSFASVAFLNTEMADTIEPAGWNNWRDPAREKTARYVEYNSTGPGANPEARVKWAKKLTDNQAEAYTPENVLRGQDGWKPQ
jgi:pectinesterase